MTDDLISARTATIRTSATDLVALGQRLRSELPGRPPPVVAPGWATATALATVEAAVRSWLVGVADRSASTADALRTAADGYDRADLRAANRLVVRR